MEEEVLGTSKRDQISLVLILFAANELKCVRIFQISRFQWKW
jgi:hypothetical protein